VGDGAVFLRVQLYASIEGRQVVLCLGLVNQGDQTKQAEGGQECNATNEGDHESNGADKGHITASAVPVKDCEALLQGWPSPSVASLLVPKKKDARSDAFLATQ
jgi:hypothetical protein